MLEDSHRSKETIRVLAGTTQLARFTTPFRVSRYADVHTVKWEVPSTVTNADNLQFVSSPRIPQETPAARSAPDSAGHVARQPTTGESTSTRSPERARWSSNRNTRVVVRSSIVFRSLVDSFPGSGARRFGNVRASG